MKHQSVFPHQWFTSAMQSIRSTMAKPGNSEAGDIGPGHGLDGNHGLTRQGCHPFYAWWRMCTSTWWGRLGLSFLFQSFFILTTKTLQKLKTASFKKRLFLSFINIAVHGILKAWAPLSPQASADYGRMATLRPDPRAEVPVSQVRRGCTHSHTV